MTETTAIQANGLHKSFGEIYAVKGVNFSIQTTSSQACCGRIKVMPGS